MDVSTWVSIGAAGVAVVFGVVAGVQAARANREASRASSAAERSAAADERAAAAAERANQIAEDAAAREIPWTLSTRATEGANRVLTRAASRTAYRVEIFTGSGRDRAATFNDIHAGAAEVFYYKPSWADTAMRVDVEWRDTPDGPVQHWSGSLT